jgi:hypothetical protein
MVQYDKDRIFQCACPLNKHPLATPLMGRAAKNKLKRYVQGGGYLFAEDWCMEDFLAEIFSEYVKYGPERPEDEDVRVFPKAGSTAHPYLRKVFAKPPMEKGGTVTEADLQIDHKWKIDRSTRCIKVVDPSRVVTLLVSPDLKERAAGHDAVAVTFAVGDKGGDVATGVNDKMTGGRVLYVLSHFGKQKVQQDEYTLQNILLNFLIEASERRLYHQEAKKGQ